jgi:hypothetical protein
MYADAVAILTPHCLCATMLCVAAVQLGLQQAEWRCALITAALGSSKARQGDYEGRVRHMHMSRLAFGLQPWTLNLWNSLDNHCMGPNQ